MRALSLSLCVLQVTLISPGIIFTEFGCNALHGGIDSRALRGVAPGQEEGEVAKVIMHAVRASRSLSLYLSQYPHTCRSPRHSHVTATRARAVRGLQLRTRAEDVYSAPGARQKMLDYLGELTRDPPPEALS